MAAKEMYDYLSTISADVDQTLALDAQGKILQEGGFYQFIHEADDESEERINLGGAVPRIFVQFDINAMSESDMGTIFDLYFDSAKANGRVNSFKWSKCNDGHIYVVRFDMELFSREWTLQSNQASKGIRLRILGRIAD